MELQPGTVKALYNNQMNNPLYKNPVLQITGLVKLPMGDAEKPRYKANISDGQLYMKAVFSSELGPLFENGTLKRYFLIRVTLFTLRPKENSNYLYIQAIGGYESADSVIGAPVSVVTGKPSSDPSPGHETSFKSVIADAVPPAPKRPSDVPDTSKKLKEVPTAIKDLNPFVTRWVVKGRVVFKSDLKTFTSSKGEGKVFNFEITDGTAQVKVVAFSNCADIFYPLVEMNKVYSISFGTVKMANKKFSSNSFDYEIQLEKNSKIIASEDTGIPQYHFDLVKISDLTVGGGLVDVVAIIKEAYPPGTVTSKSTGQDLTKRDLILLDETGNVRLTLWGPKAEEEYLCDEVVCLKSVKVGEYNGVTLSTTAASQVISNCDIPEARNLISWYRSAGKDVVIETSKKPQKYQTISDLKSGSSEYSNIRCSILFLKEDSLFYESCPSGTCNKKVSADEGSGYRCERCNYIYETCGYRYMVSAHIGDYSGQAWVTLFDDVATALFGMPASELKALGDGDPMELQNLVKGSVGRDYVMKIRMREDVYNGEPRQRFTCLGLHQNDILKETMNMLSIIEKVY